MNTDSLKSDLVELSITSLMSCLQESEAKEKFIKDLKKTEYEKIVKHMRDESTVIQMRDFHNWVKLVLITNIADFIYSEKQNRVSLLDIAVGRGGDLVKWKKAQISNVFGFDPSEKSIKSTAVEDPGAIQRFKELKKKGYNVDVQFEVGDATRPLDIKQSIDSYISRKRLGKGFDMVSCQFALHYFFSSENALRNVLSLVSHYLVPGGFFFGTTVDGSKIREYTSDNKVFDRKLYQVNRLFPKNLKSPFGNAYTFKIYDTFDQTNYFNTMGESTEYLVDFNVLNKLAGEFGLEPVNLNFFEKYSPTGLKKDTTYMPRIDNIIPFEEIYTLKKWTPREGNISASELELSFLNSVFVFRKKL
jgi:mRNA (guanine-N7-)-methyltransferase